ncbi:MAG: SDR family oxidoreductase [Ectothiorhodospiraceae bacterium]|nr:SDR family oxidoreductase [Ectothiorhodospiraceae bacterium]
MALQNKGIIITGGASGIGAATARMAMERGAQVVIADMNDALGGELAAELGKDRCRFVRTDVTSTESVETLFREAAAFCTVDGVFNNAGIGHQAMTVDYTDAEWMQVIDINLNGVFRVAREAMRHMGKRGGSIVNCASILGHVGQTQTAAYTAAKGGVLNLTRTLALEGAPDGIRVNSLSPGYIATPLLDQLEQEVLDFLTSLHPVGRLGRAEEVAGAALFLLSDEASFITGTDLLVDGGFTAGKS